MSTCTACGQPLPEPTRSRGRTWKVPLAGNEPLSLNDRVHRNRRATQVAQWRSDTAYSVRSARVPALDRVQVVLRAWPPTARTRDEDNLVASLKPAIDGLRDARVIPDDSPEYVASSLVWLEPPTGDPQRRWRWQLEIEEVVDP